MTPTNTRRLASRLALSAALATAFPSVHAAVGADEAATLKSTLTPFGAERAANKDGTIPAWTGAATPGGDIGPDGRRKDPFASEKPLYSVTSKNMDQYADKLTEGTKAMLKKYPDAYRIDVYPTRRTAIAPQWVYDAVAKNAVNAKIADVSAGSIPENFTGPIPFPIPKAGVEVLWNHLLRWRAPNLRIGGRNYQVTEDGTWIMIGDVVVDSSYPFLQNQGQGDKSGEYLLVRSRTFGPAIRAGEQITGRLAIDDDKSNTWLYLTGQRRVRKLPNPCCDTPGPFSAGIASFDEVNVFTGRTSRFDWKLVGKKEVFIPYNSNRTLQRKDSEMQGPRFLNPDGVRWELHRVWVVDATLKSGQRHTSPKGRYYFDEDTWIAVIAERYDASGALARVPFQLPVVQSDVPATGDVEWGIYDLIGGSTFIANFLGEKKDPVRPMATYADSVFTPDAMAGEGVR